MASDKPGAVQTAGSGEIDGLYINVYQGGPDGDFGSPDIGDCAGILVGVTICGKSGYASIFEGASREILRAEGDFATVRSINTHVGAINVTGAGFDGPPGAGIAYAYTAIANTGVIDYGNYVADSPSGTFRRAFSYWAAGAGEVFAVSGTEALGGPGNILVGTAADRWEIHNSGGSFMVFDRPGLAQMFAVDKGSQLTLGTTIVLKKRAGDAAGFTAGTGTPNKGTFNAATATTGETAARLLALEQALSYHGIIGA